MSDRVPVVLFAFRRADLLARTLASLRANGVPLIYAFSDGPRDAGDEAGVAEVRSLLHNVDWAEMHVVERPVNVGLTPSVVAGITAVLGIHEEVVVSEDDIEFAPGAYGYLVAALERYRSEPRAMSVSAWTHPRMTPADAHDAPHFTGRFICWGWATWRRAWNGFPGLSAAELRDRCLARGIDIGKYGRDIPDWYAAGVEHVGWDYMFGLHMMLHEGLMLLPPYAMTVHTGNDHRASHPAGPRRLGRPGRTGAPARPDPLAGRARESGQRRMLAPCARAAAAAVAPGACTPPAAADHGAGRHARTRRMSRAAAPAGGPRAIVSVIVPTWRRVRSLERCLRSLAGQSRLPDEVVVGVRADDADSARAVAEMAPVFPVPLRAARTDTPGVVASMNAALATCRPDGAIVAVTDDDTEPRRDWLERLTACFSDPAVGGAGGRDWQPLERGDRAVVGQVQWFGRMIGNHHLGAGPARDVDLLKGANCAFRASCCVRRDSTRASRARARRCTGRTRVCLRLGRRLAPRIRSRDRGGAPRRAPQRRQTSCTAACSRRARCPMRPITRRWCSSRTGADARARRSSRGRSPSERTTSPARRSSSACCCAAIRTHSRDGARRSRVAAAAGRGGALDAAAARRGAAVASAMNPMRVLVVMPLGTALGGGEVMLRQLISRGRGHGVDWIVVFLRDGPMVAELRALGPTVHVVEAGRFRNVTSARLRAISRDRATRTLQPGRSRARLDGRGPAHGRCCGAARGDPVRLVPGGHAPARLARPSGDAAARARHARAVARRGDRAGTCAAAPKTVAGVPRRVARRVRSIRASRAEGHAREARVAGAGGR